MWIAVVICFQISIFEPLETTFFQRSIADLPVVICFQISIFEPLETTIQYFHASNRSCDLLSN